MAVDVAPSVGEFWTNGKALVEIVGIGQNGDYEVQDATHDVNDPSVEILLVGALAKEEWRRVPHG